MDQKGLGYFVSLISVLLLGAVAWPGPDEPRWKVIALAAGMAASAVGMFIRYLSHREEQREIDEAKRSGPGTARESA
jgi:uncharacterized membrane protein YhhN